MPTVDTRNTGLFWVEHAQLSDAWHMELGARHEWLDHDVLDDPSARPGFNRSAKSFSGALVREFDSGVALSLSAAHSERLPHAQELYARGIHLATNTYECGLLPSALTCGHPDQDRAIATETSRNIELGLRRDHGALTFALNLFVNHVDNYVHARTLDQHEAFRLIKYSQAEARFAGFEAELGYQLSQALNLSVFTDRVRGKLSDGGGNLPRIAPARYGVRVNGHWSLLDANLSLTRVQRQDDIASFEQPTAGYNMLNLSLSHAIGGNDDFQVYLHGSNLLNRLAWNHSSFLANVVPLPGRNISLGLRYTF